MSTSSTASLSSCWGGGGGGVGEGGGWGGRVHRVQLIFMLARNPPAPPLDLRPAYQSICEPDKNILSGNTEDDYYDIADFGEIAYLLLVVLILHIWILHPSCIHLITVHFELHLQMGASNMQTNSWTYLTRPWTSNVNCTTLALLLEILRGNILSNYFLF